MSLTKTNIPGYVKDEKRGFVINSNVAEYNAFINRRKQIQDAKNSEQQIKELKSEVADLKSLLLSVLQKLDKKD